jgi:chitin synthase
VTPSKKVPILVIVKCGAPDEKDSAKPGNRGKRDSQLILMSFFHRLIFKERVTPLDYELFCKWRYITGVSPVQYETLLMVDADTVVRHDSIMYMIRAMKNNPKIMGLCGETQVTNKNQNWVTSIQVFEYFLSHHLGKAFESVFGGVTCLPGCFSMYRIKAMKGPGGKWIVPLLVNPDVIQGWLQHGD